MQFENATVEKIIAHRVGNKIREEPLTLSSKDSIVDQNLSSILLSSYLRNISSEKNQYTFHHENDLNLNEARHHINQYFSGLIDFLDLSKKMAVHLHEKSSHPNIKAGDFLIILFNNIKHQEHNLRAIGLFKSDVIDSYITINEKQGNLAVTANSGINPNLIDKGALVFEKNLDVFAIDRLSNRTKFWTDDFLQIKKYADQTTSSKIITYASAKIAEAIGDPIIQQKYSEKIIDLCNTEAEFDFTLLKDQSQNFITDNELKSILSSTEKRFGVDLSNSISAPSNSIKKTMKRVASHINIGFGLKLLLPDNKKCTKITHNQSADGEITFNIKVI